MEAEIKALWEALLRQHHTLTERVRQLEIGIADANASKDIAWKLEQIAQARLAAATRTMADLGIVDPVGLVEIQYQKGRGP